MHSNRGKGDDSQNYLCLFKPLLCCVSQTTFIKENSNPGFGSRIDLETLFFSDLWPAGSITTATVNWNGRGPERMNLPLLYVFKRFLLPLMIKIINCHRESRLKLSATPSNNTNLKSAFWGSCLFFFLHLPPCFLLLSPGRFHRKKAGQCAVGRLSSPVPLSDSLGDGNFSTSPLQQKKAGT